MKTGKSITDLAKEIERRANAKRDLIVRSPSVGMAIGDDSKTPLLTLPMQSGVTRFGINEIAHEQIASYTGIPRQYYERCRAERPALLAAQVNEWFGSMPKDARMVRLLDGRARALLSDKFNRDMENEDLAQPLFEVLNQVDAEVVSCEITDTRFYVKAVDRKINRQIQEKTGNKLGDGSHVRFSDVLMPALVVSNSEVGRGALSVRRSVLKEGCTNLLIMKEQGVRKTHVGSRHDVAGEYAVELSERTKKLKGAALISELRDVIAGSFDEKTFQANVDRMQNLTSEKIEGDLAAVIDVTRKHFGMTDAESRVVQRHLIEGADLSRWGLLNAITRTAEDLPDYDRATDFERFGGDVIELSPNEWRKIAQAA